jgi:hypothetical protein
MTISRMFSEIAHAATIAEEQNIMAELSRLIPRIHALPYRRNCNTPGHRVRSLCYRMWAESEREALTYIEAQRKELGKG